MQILTVFLYSVACIEPFVLPDTLILHIHVEYKSKKKKLAIWHRFHSKRLASLKHVSRISILLGYNIIRFYSKSIHHTGALS